MPIDARTENGVLVIKPDDQRLDASNAVAFRESLFAHIDGGVRKMVLDLSGVRFVDSSALGALISVLKRMDPLGKLAIAGVQPAVARLFSITRMDRVFAIHPGAREAVAVLSAG